MLLKHRAHPELPPGPSFPSVLQLHRLLMDGRGFMAAAHRRFGDVFTIRPFGMPPAVCFVAPEAISQILRASPEVFGNANQTSAGAVGRESVILLDGDPHHRARRRIMPSFTGPPLRRLGPLMTDVIDETIDALHPGQHIDFLEVSREATLHIIFRTLFGLRPGERYDTMRADVLTTADNAQRASALMACTVIPPEIVSRVTQGRVSDDGARLPDPWWVRPLLRDPLVVASRRLRDELRGFVRDARAGVVRPPEETAFAQILERLARDPDADSVTDEHLASELLTLLIAGHETTAVSLGWALQLLLAHPECWRALRSEVRAHLPGGRPIDAREVEALPYLDAVVRESMRVEPIVAAVVRRALVDTEIAGVHIPAGVLVQPFAAGVHRDPRIYTDPLRFDPDRMLDRRCRPETLLPFGGGYRRCIGAAFAIQEIKLFLVRVAQCAELRLNRDAPLAPARSGVITHPVGGAPMVVEAIRSPSDQPEARALR